MANREISSKGLTLHGISQYSEKRKRGFMPERESNRTSRIEARISADSPSVVKRAAEIEGRSISEFVVAAAQEAAKKTIEETHLLRLSTEDQRRLVDLLLDPPPPAPALLRALEARSRMIVDSPKR